MPGNYMETEQKGLTEKRYATFEQVKELQSKGYSARAIARHLRISRTTTSKYFQQEAFIPKVNRRQSNLLDYECYLRKRWLEGQQCVKTLLKEIKAKDYNGAYIILAGLLADYPRTPDPSKLPPAKKVMSFSSRSLGIILCQQEIDWEEKDKPFFKRLLEKSSQHRQLRELNLELKCMIDQKKGENLHSWCERANLHSFFKKFVQGIRQDFEAVYQAMTSIWSNGQTEGQVNRLKNINRQMYGRVSFELLRIRVLTDSSWFSPKVTQNQ